MIHITHIQTFSKISKKFLNPQEGQKLQPRDKIPKSSDARLFCKNKQTNLKNKPKMGNLTEKQAQRAFGRKIKKT